jgi:hypothetical protein
MLAMTSPAGAATGLIVVVSMTEDQFESGDLRRRMIKPHNMYEGIATFLLCYNQHNLNLLTFFSDIQSVNI